MKSGIHIGEYYIGPAPSNMRDHSWISHADGEGMTIENEKIEAVFQLLFSLFF